MRVVTLGFILYFLTFINSFANEQYELYIRYKLPKHHEYHIVRVQASKNDSVNKDIVFETIIHSDFGTGAAMESYIPLRHEDYHNISVEAIEVDDDAKTANSVVWKKSQQGLLQFPTISKVLDEASPAQMEYLHRLKLDLVNAIMEPEYSKFRENYEKGSEIYLSMRLDAYIGPKVLGIGYNLHCDKSKIYVVNVWAAKAGSENLKLVSKKVVSAEVTQAEFNVADFCYKTYEKVKVSLTELTKVSGSYTYNNFFLNFGKDGKGGKYVTVKQDAGLEHKTVQMFLKQLIIDLENMHAVGTYAKKSKLLHRI